MNFEMMLLADCIPLFSGDENSKTAVAEHEDLIKYIKSIGEVFEIRAVAYRDVSSLTNTDSEPRFLDNSSNLYRAWYLTQNAAAGIV